MSYVLAADSMGLSSLKFLLWAQKRMHFETRDMQIGRLRSNRIRIESGITIRIQIESGIESAKSPRLSMKKNKNQQK